MKKQHRTLIGAAALSLAVAGSLAGAVPAKADGHEVCGTCPSSPRVAALEHVLYKLNLVMEKHTPILDKSSPLENVMYKINEIILKW